MLTSATTWKLKGHWLFVRMWRFRKSNGITEGFHRKMKLIQRSAYELGALHLTQ